MALELDDAEFEIDGYRIKYVSDFDNEKPEVRDQDADLPLGDGRLFGRDRFKGSKITLEGDLVFPEDGEPEDVHKEYENMSKAWSGDSVRGEPGEVSVLRGKWFGNVRRVYGRPRKFSPEVTKKSAGGQIPFTADFTCADHRWYDDDESSESISIVGPTATGIVFPLVFPMDLEGSGSKPGQIDVGGDVETWPVITVYGPIKRPRVEVFDQWEIEVQTTLKYDRYLTIDPRPWKRTVLRDDGASLAGNFTKDSRRLSKLSLEPGLWSVNFAGTDDTGTAKLEIAWRNAYRTL